MLAVKYKSYKERLAFDSMKESLGKWKYKEFQAPAFKGPITKHRNKEAHVTHHFEVEVS